MARKALAEIFMIVAIFVYPVIVTCQSRGESYRGPSTSAVRGYLDGRSQQYQSQSQPYPEFYQQQSQSQSFSNSALNYNSPPYPDYQNQPAQYSQSSIMQQSAYQPVVNIPLPPPLPSYSEYYDPPPKPINSRPLPPDYSQAYHPINSRPLPQTYNKPAVLAEPYSPQNFNKQSLPPPEPYNPTAYRPPTQNYNKPIAQSPEPYKPKSTSRPQSPQYYNKVQSQQNSNLDNRFGGEEASTQSQSSGAIETFTVRPTRKGTRRPPTTKLPPRFDNRDDAVFKKTLNFDAELSNSMELFALELLYDFNSRLESDNFMISPFSVYHLLVLIAEGAAGNTLAELTDKLKLGSLERTRDFQQYLNVVLNRNTADVILKKFSMIVTDKARPVNPEYETRVEKAYEADVYPVNFLDMDNTLRSINSAVSNYTEGQITETVKREDLFKAQLILISGLYFQGKWMNVFNTSFTKAEPFYDTNGNKIGDVNMMFQRGPFAYAGVSDLGCHILELPFAEMPVSSRNDLSGTGLSMILVLPRKGLSLNEAIENIHKFGMAKLYRELYNSKVEYEDDEVEVHVPRFEITSSLDMKETLEGMEIKDVFDQSRADLSNINKQYFVSSMIHKTKISVDEYGTTAAAVTTSIFANKATPPKFHANKPFLFFVVDKVTNLILFSGQYVNPSLF